MKSNYSVQAITLPGDSATYRFYGDGYSPNDSLEMIKYAKMSKAFMNKPFNDPNAIVGNFEWHEQYPYEEMLLHGIDIGPPASQFIADFGCGPGRMINRFKKMGYRVDGVDISTFALAHLKKLNPDETYYESSGIDLGEIVANQYSLIYSTIAMQHIPSRKIRNNIFRGMYNALDEGGWISVQVGYNPTYKAGVWSHDTEHALYEDDFWNTKGTNGHSDMVINADNVHLLKEDMIEIFGNCKLELDNVDKKYNNLNGAHHSKYWCSDWLYIKCQK